MQTNVLLLYFSRTVDTISCIAEKTAEVHCVSPTPDGFAKLTLFCHSFAVFAQIFFTAMYCIQALDSETADKVL